jgi:hypothetical protein
MPLVDLNQDELVVIAVALKELKERTDKNPKRKNPLLIGKNYDLDTARDKIAEANPLLTVLPSTLR